MAMPPHDDDLQAERLLRAARPQPDERFVAGLEQRLLGRPARARGGRLRTLAVAFGATGALAATALGLTLAGQGPLAGSGEVVRAKDDCRMVRVWRVERRPVLVQADGQARIRYERVRTSRLVRRCR